MTRLPVLAVVGAVSVMALPAYAMMQYGGRVESTTGDSSYSRSSALANARSVAETICSRRRGVYEYLSQECDSYREGGMTRWQCSITFRCNS